MLIILNVCGLFGMSVRSSAFMFKRKTEAVSDLTVK